ncbi:MAG: FHA domain-containing protein [Chloroflexaceae bacterium]|nr:FHA domain-containing protein [Chloroflexaceae bacterium]NJL33675.1 FHA domain-containing protein [Chloroflexaceae bacterium]NJO07359.1 FHA domain-containing protein [Chloroflexaceae bacterium]
MQKCWNCDAEQLNGAIFCTECGANLIGRQQRQETTTSLEGPGDAEEWVVPAPRTLEATAASAFTLVVLNDGRRLLLETNRNLLVGRTDQRRGIIPDVDLSNYGGYDAGVSRRHALLAVRDKQCYVEDLGSANGTFVNSEQVAPNQPVLLNHGDELKFGTLLLRVELNFD